MHHLRHVHPRDRTERRGLGQQGGEEDTSRKKDFRILMQIGRLTSKDATYSRQLQDGFDRFPEDDRMARTFGVYGPAHPVLGKVSEQLCLPLWKAFSARKHFFTADSAYARQRAALMQQKLLRGETVYLLGIGIRTHNTGVALVEVSRASGVRLISNNEEERYVGQKHYDRFPEQAVEALQDADGRAKHQG